MRALKPFSILAITVLLTGGFFMLAGSACRHGEPFPVAEFEKTPGNLEGNRYILEAEVDAQLKGQPGVGRIISVRPLKEKARLPLFIADSLSANLLVAQRYRFDLTVRKGGLLYVNSLTKI